MSKLPSVAPIAKNTTMIGDSGASKHCIKEDDDHILTSTRFINNGPQAILPDLTTIQSTKEGTLPIKSLSSTATQSLVYPRLQNSSLLSIGQLCDDDCLAIFDKEHLHVIKDDQVILKGFRNDKDKLWHIPFPPKNILRFTE